MDTLISSLKQKLGTAKRVYLQAPEGLKTRILGMASALEKEGVEVVVGCDPTYGACDLRDKEAKELGCDLLIHIGHSTFGIKACLPVVYEPYPLESDAIPLLKKHLPALESYTTISLVTTVQFASALPEATAFLEEAGKTVLFAKQVRNQQEGLLLGCDWSAALPLQDQVDCFLYIGSGKFHPLGLARMTDRPVLGIDLETGEFTNYREEKMRLEKIKAFHIAQAQESERFGILVSMKEGQRFFAKARELKRVLEEKGKRAWILVMDEVSPAKIAGMKLDVLVNCGCPRIDEDFTLFKKPILNPQDVPKV